MTEEMIKFLEEQTKGDTNVNMLILNAFKYPLKGAVSYDFSKA